MASGWATRSEPGRLIGPLVMGAMHNDTREEAHPEIDLFDGLFVFVTPIGIKPD